MTQLFLQAAILHLDENLPRIQKCVDALTLNEIWMKPNENTNAIGNLILHLNGNVRQYILSGLNGETDVRKRAEEFEKARELIPGEDLLQLIGDTLIKARKVIESLTEDKLSKMYEIQGFKLSGFKVVIHVVEHLSYHVGQISLLTKLQKNLDLGYYAGLDLNIQNPT